MLVPSGRTLYLTSCVWWGCRDLHVKKSGFHWFQRVQVGLFFIDLTEKTSIKYSLRSIAQLFLLARLGTLTWSLRSLDSSYINSKGIPPLPLSINVLPEGVPFTTKFLLFTECFYHSHDSSFDFYLFFSLFLDGLGPDLSPSHQKGGLLQKCWLSFHSNILKAYSLLFSTSL